MWKDIVLICIVLKTCIRLNGSGVLSNTGFHYNTGSYNILPYYTGGRHVGDRMVVEFTTACAVSAYRH